MDAIPAILILVPIIPPVALRVGIHPALTACAVAGIPVTRPPPEHPAEAAGEGLDASRGHVLCFSMWPSELFVERMFALSPTRAP